MDLLARRLKEGGHHETGLDNARRELEAREGWLEKVGYSSGGYGLNGGLLKGHNSGTLYAITARTTALFIYF